MIRYYRVDEECHLLIDSECNKQERKLLAELLQERKKERLVITFVNIEIISREGVYLLYEAQKSSSLQIKVFSSKLFRYLVGLGFDSVVLEKSPQKLLNLAKIEILLIGASSESTKKIVEMVAKVDMHAFAMIIVQHTGGSTKGLFESVLQNYTTTQVGYAQDGELVQANRIYIAPPDFHLLVKNQRLQLIQGGKEHFARPSVSVSYRSFSEEYMERLCIVQECGYGSDGVDALEYAKERGASVVIQDPAECQDAKSMPEKALESKAYDLKLTTEEIVLFLQILSLKEEDALLRAFLQATQERYGYNFSHYDQEMILRRLEMLRIKKSDMTLKSIIVEILFDYAFFKEFFFAISIGVTEFFRYPEAFDALGKVMQEEKKRLCNIKIWSAGCSSGEEAYSLAMMLQKLGVLQKSLIYATDYNRYVLKRAQNALYGMKVYKKSLQNYKQTGLEGAFDDFIEKSRDFFEIKEELRKKVLFFKHNLTSDGSFNEFAIITCRNVLIYFDEILQKKVLQLLYDSLMFGGYLLLGEAELIHPAFASKFVCVNEKARLYQKVA